MAEELSSTFAGNPTSLDPSTVRIYLPAALPGEIPVSQPRHSSCYRRPKESWERQLITL
jgi:hypothetical protein